MHSTPTATPTPTPSPNSKSNPNQALGVEAACPDVETTSALPWFSAGAALRGGGSLGAGLWMAGVGAVAFSGKAVIVKLGYRYGADAITLLMYRMLMALPFFLALYALASRGRSPLTARDRWAILGMGFSGYYLASLLDFAGLAYISVGLERLILYLNPTLVLLLGWVIKKRGVSGAQSLALAVSYLGVVAVFAHEVSLVGQSVGLGSALVFGSAFSYAVYLVYSGELVQRLGALRLTGAASSVAAVFCMGHFLLASPLSSVWVPAQVLWLSLLNATLCTVLPVVLVMMAVERLGPALAAQAGMVGPLSTLLLGALVLDEPLTLTTALGTALVLLGIGLLARANRR